MLDHFLQSMYEREDKQEKIATLQAAMKDLSPEQLAKVAFLSSNTGEAPWITRFKDTPLFEKAMQLEQAELEIERMRLEQEALSNSSRFYQQQDAIRLQKRLLDLELMRVMDTQSGLGAPKSPDAPGGMLPPPPPELAAQPGPEGGPPKTASDKSPLSYDEKAWGTKRELLGQGLGAAGGALLGGALGAGPPGGAASGALLGGTLGLLGGRIAGHFSQSPEQRAKLREARIAAQGVGMGLIDAKAELANRIRNRPSGVSEDEAIRSYGDDIAMNRGGAGLGAGMATGGLLGAGLGGPAGMLVGGAAGGALGYHLGRTSGKGRAHELAEEIHGEKKAEFASVFGRELAHQHVKEAQVRSHVAQALGRK